MAHELTQNQNGEKEFFYCGEKPWHGLGQKLERPATAADAIKASNLGWTVSRRPIMTTCGIDIPGKVAIVRDDNSLPLSVMSEAYSPVQNVEAFAFFDSVVGTGGAFYETAGSVFQGKKIFLVAKLPEYLLAGREDRIDQYLTLVNSHDGSSALRMYFTPIRVVCNNTLMMSLSNMRESVSILHLGDVNKRIVEAQDALGMAHRYYADFQKIVDRLVKAAADKKLVEKFINGLFKLDPKEKVSPITQKAIDKVVGDFENDPKNNLPKIKGTAWALYNAAAQYADHECVSVSKDADHRMNSILFGHSQEFKTRALDQILELVPAKR